MVGSIRSLRRARKRASVRSLVGPGKLAESNHMSDALRAGLSLTPDELELVQHQMKTGELHWHGMLRPRPGILLASTTKPAATENLSSRASVRHCSLAATASTRTKSIAVTNPTFFGERQLVARTKRLTTSRNGASTGLSRPVRLIGLRKLRLKWRQRRRNGDLCIDDGAAADRLLMVWRAGWP